MGRMNDALRKAAEERARRRRLKGHEDVHVEDVITPPEVEDRPEPEPEPDKPSRRQARVDERPTATREDPRAEVPPETEVYRIDPDDIEELDTPDLRGRTQRAATSEVVPVIAPGTSRTERARRKAREDDDTFPPTPLPKSRTRYEVDPRVICYHHVRDPRAEQFRTIRTALLSMDPLPESLMVTSGTHGEGKSLAAVNLAASLVEGGNRNVLLIDGNLRHPELMEICAARSKSGLSCLMGGKQSVTVEGCIQQTAIAGVDLITAGLFLDNPGALLSPKALSGVLALVERDYDFVIVDSPALDEFADAAVMAPEVDGVILVCQVGGPPRSHSEKAIELLESARARTLGIVAMNCKD